MAAAAGADLDDPIGPAQPARIDAAQRQRLIEALGRMCHAHHRLALWRAEMMTLFAGRVRRVAAGCALMHAEAQAGRTARGDAADS